MKIVDLLSEFCSTYEEWHYFVGGAAIGFIAGVVAGLAVVVILG